MARRYLAALAGGFAAIAGGLAGFNAIVDPPLDTRQEKTEAMFDERAGCGAPGVILGSSRIGTAGAVMTSDGTWFNLAMEDLFPAEYEGYLVAYEEACGQAPARVVIALDFFAASRHRYARADYPPPAHYVVTARDPLWPLRKAGSLDVLAASLDTVLDGRDGAFRGESQARVADEWQLRAMWYYRDVYRRFAFNEELDRIFVSLQARFPETHWTVLTTPVSEPVFSLMLDHDLLDEYARWLRTAVSAFGAVHHFGGLNRLTLSPRHFQDENHLHPAHAAALVRSALGDSAPAALPDGIPVLLTAATLPGYLDELHRAAGR